MNRFMKIAIEEALKGLKQDDGGPFGAVLVRNGRIVARAHNKVVRTNDPTAHAEILALRRASSRLRRFDLSDCEIYSLCEPCPMCLSAIHWARAKRVYYGCTSEDAAKIGFDDKSIDDAIRGISNKRRVRAVQVDREECLKAFKKWESKEDKIRY